MASALPCRASVTLSACWKIFWSSGKTITGADGGTLYSVTEDQSALKFEILRTDSLGIRLGGTTGKTVDLAAAALAHARWRAQ